MIARNCADDADITLFTDTLVIIELHLPWPRKILFEDVLLRIGVSLQQKYLPRYHVCETMIVQAKVVLISSTNVLKTKEMNVS